MIEIDWFKNEIKETISFGVFWFQAIATSILISGYTLLTGLSIIVIIGFLFKLTCN